MEHESVLGFKVKLTIDLDVRFHTDDSSLACRNPHCVGKVEGRHKENNDRDEKWKLESESVPQAQAALVVLIGAVESEDKRAHEPDESQLAKDDRDPDPTERVRIKPALELNIDWDDW